jgi:hypothetical protein
MITGGIGGLAVWWLCTRRIFQLDDPAELPLYVCIAPGLLLLLIALLTTLFIGLSSGTTSDDDREWLSRAGAWVLIVVVGWTVGSAISLFGPGLPGWVSSAIASFGGLAGVLTALLGYGHWTPAQEPKDPKEQSLATRVSNLLLKIAAPIFVVALLVVLSLFTFWLVDQFMGPFPPGSQRYKVSAALSALGVAASLAGVDLLMGRFVHVNIFSLHAMYRNRLIRAYLGASRLKSERKPHLFTGFAESDDLQMTEISQSRPFHVINMALNLVHGKQLAWQERKAESFIVSPLHAGSCELDSFRPVSQYGRGLSVGTAAAISGAAATPNMGYHSSPAITFLMTFFNVRLGWWLGNPAHAGWNTWALPGPRYALRPIVAEALGRTDDLNPYVYLSDGGHFENLGLYEMVLRRCHLIVVCDAGEDSKRTFGDLGNAVRKIRVDMGIPIEFKGGGPGAPNALGGYGAVGSIRYSCVDPDAPDGLLIYVKPALNGSEPVDLRNYATLHPEFPHQSTTNQWFDESQFESYRMLGSHIIENVCYGVSGSLAELKERAAGFWL